ncbi:MAG: hypothetical protein ACPG5B_04395 [Chitinophagales bacterium]
MLYSQKTNEVKSIPKNISLFDDQELWVENIIEVEENEDYILIEAEKMSSREAFRMMEDFAHSVNDTKIKDGLFMLQ